MSTEIEMATSSEVPKKMVSKDLENFRCTGYETLKEATTALLTHLCVWNLGQFCCDPKRTGSRRTVYRCYGAFKRAKGEKAVWVGDTTDITCEKRDDESDTSYKRRLNKLRDRQLVEGVCPAKAVLVRFVGRHIPWLFNV